MTGDLYFEEVLSSNVSKQWQSWLLVGAWESLSSTTATTCHLQNWKPCVMAGDLKEVSVGDLVFSFSSKL